VEPEGVGFQGVPSAVEPPWAAFPGTDPVFPVVAGYEVSAGVADDGGPEFLDELEHVLPEAVFVGLRVARFVDAGVDAAAHMLNEGAKKAAGHLPDGEVSVQGNSCAGHVGFLLLVEQVRWK
jgi:hypothetical protein